MNAEAAVARQAFRQVRLGAVVWGAIFAAVVASSAETYVRTFPTAAARAQLAATTGRDAGVSILLGPISSIDTVAGYTVYKGYVTLTTIGAIWALLAATRLLRGEEDAGRRQMVLSGATRPGRAASATLVGIGAAVLVVVACTTLGTALAGRDPAIGFSAADSLVYGLSIAIPPAVFAAVGAVTSQLAGSRRGATALGMIVMAFCFVVRMIADSGQATRWLLWVTPFGWTERIRPMTGNALAPVALAVAAVVVLTALAVALAAGRDVGSGVFADRDVAPMRLFGPTGPLGFAARLELPVLLGWLAGVAAAGLCFGIVAELATGSLPASMSSLLDKFDVRGTFLQQYLGIAFLMMAAIVALLPASQIGAFAEEESTGRIVNLLAQPTRRTALFAGRMTISAGAVAVAGPTAGLCTWFGARLRGIDIGLPSMLGAGCNLVPTALLVLAVGAVARALAPRHAAAVGYGVVAWSFLVELVGSLVSGTRWLSDLSVFRYMARAPAESVDATTVVLMLGFAAALLGAATFFFSRRDVA